MSLRHVSPILGLGAVAALGVAAYALPASAAPAPIAPAQQAHARHAGSDADALRKGRLLSNETVVARDLPTTASFNRGALARGSVIDIQCKVHGSVVGGNDLWYLRPAEVYEFVPARYVANVGPAPKFCGAGLDYVGRTTASLNERKAPTTAAATGGTIRPGSKLVIGCKLPGPSVGGNANWYYLSDGRWVSARYVANVGAAPDLC